ncbi:MAG: TetR family transcriptional regulator C-terminal domain-containing protein [Clostridia bacterium]|nr:TetR family transcriptional regulator C-terminal domain-containing protein [Clostridia bacterium]
MTQANEVSQKKEDRRVRRTKKMLTQALTQLLQEKQINEITVKELTDLADMNRGTFYLYYKDIFDMLEKIEDGLFEALEEIVFLHEHDDVSQQTKPILLDLFRFIEDIQEMCRVLLSPHGDMNFLHRLNEVVREKCLQMWPNKEDKNDATFEYHYSFVVYGCVGVFRAWLNSECQEPAEKMAEMADAMIRRGSLSIA